MGHNLVTSSGLAESPRRPRFGDQRREALPGTPSGPGRPGNGLHRLTGLRRRLLGWGRFWLRRILRRGLHDSPPLSSSQALYPSGDKRKHPGDQRADRRDQRGIGALSKYGLYHRNKGLGRPRDPQVPLAGPGAVGRYWTWQDLRAEPRRGTRGATSLGASAS